MRAGLDPQGPNIVVSTMGVYGFDTQDGGETGSCEMVLEKTFPKLSLDVVRAMAGPEGRCAGSGAQAADHRGNRRCEAGPAAVLPA